MELLRTCPRELCGIEVNYVVVDRGSRSYEFAAHCHEESVEGIDGRFSLYFDLTTVKSSSELYLRVFWVISHCAWNL